MRRRLQRSLEEWRGPKEQRLDLERQEKRAKDHEDWRRLHLGRNGFRASVDEERRTPLGDWSNIANNHVSSCHLSFVTSPFESITVPRQLKSPCLHTGSDQLLVVALRRLLIPSIFKHCSALHVFTSNSTN